MAKASTGTKLQRSSVDLLRGGIEISEAAVQRQLAAIAAEAKATFAEESKLRQQAAKYRNIIERPATTPRPNGETAAAIEGLRSITDRLAKHKLAFPAVPRRIPGVVFGSYTIVATPPYFRDAQDTSTISGNPSTVSSADATSGQMSCDVLTDLRAPSAGAADAYLALYFAPMFGPAILRIRPELSIAFSWSTNSLGPDAISEAQGLIRVYLDDSFDVVARAAFLGWSVNANNELKFDFGTYPSPSSSLDLSVNTGHYYLVVFSVHCKATAAGWPGSLANSTVSMSVPSVTFEVDYQPLIAQ